MIAIKRGKYENIFLTMRFFQFMVGTIYDDGMQYNKEFQIYYTAKYTVEKNSNELDFIFFCRSFFSNKLIYRHHLDFDRLYI